MATKKKGSAPEKKAEKVVKKIAGIIDPERISLTVDRKSREIAISFRITQCPIRKKDKGTSTEKHRLFSYIMNVVEVLERKHLANLLKDLL
jgi:hypothetical protein